MTKVLIVLWIEKSSDADFEMRGFLTLLNVEKLQANCEELVCGRSIIYAVTVLLLLLLHIGNVDVCVCVMLYVFVYFIIFDKVCVTMYV
jgi:hypothetical protein